jgi:hypothetical protein
MIFCRHRMYAAQAETAVFFCTDGSSFIGGPAFSRRNAARKTVLMK